MSTTPLAPFFRRDGTARDLTFQDYVTLAKVTPGRARTLLTFAVSAGTLTKGHIKCSGEKIPVYALARQEAAA